jgi:acyl-CoA thioester hydrolase
MITSENKIQIRYDEVDKMGYVYHGNYARFYHISRTELMRKIGFSDKELEAKNILLPVIEMNIKYLKPVFYDDVITIKTTLQNIPASRMRFKHEVYNSNNEVINQAESTVVFVDMQTRKPMKAPGFIVDKIELQNNISGLD